jgi:hypothetical protein
MKVLPLLVAGVMAAPAAAGTISITIPRLTVAEYHRPYVAAWIEPVGGGATRTLFVWYEVKKGGNEPGTKWLADLRAWWRKGGRSLSLPADSVSGATRAPGTYRIPIPANIGSGQYILHVEAARETGGRELVSVPFPVSGPAASASGKTELGAIAINLR